MTPTRRRAGGVLIGMLWVTCTVCSGDPLRDAARDRSEIDDIRGGFAEAFATGDVERLLAYYDDDYVDMSTGVTTRRKPAMRRAFTETFREWRGHLSIRPEEVLQSGDWALEWGTFTIFQVHRTTGEETASQRRYLEVLVRRGARWYIFRDLDNELPRAQVPSAEVRSPTRDY